MPRASDPEARDRARRLRADGYTAREIADKIGRPYSTVYDWVGRPTLAARGATDDAAALAEAARLRTEENLSSVRIAQRLGVSRRTVARWLIDLPTNCGVWSSAEIDTLERLWTTGVPLSEMMVALPGRSPGALQAKASGLGFQRGRNLDRGVNPVRRKPRPAVDVAAMTHPAVLQSAPANSNEDPAPPAEPSVPWHRRIAPRVYVDRRWESRPSVVIRPPDVGAVGGGFSMFRRRS